MKWNQEPQWFRGSKTDSGHFHNRRFPHTHTVNEVLPRILIHQNFHVCPRDLTKTVISNKYFFLLALQPPWALAFSFIFIIIFTDGRTPWTSDQLVARPLPTHRTTQTQNKHIHTPNIHVLSGIRTYDPSVRASEDSSRLRPLGYCDRHQTNITEIQSRMMPWLEHVAILFPSLYSPLNPGCFFNFLIPYAVGRIPWTGKQPIARPPPTHRTTQTQNKRTQISMLRVGLELRPQCSSGWKRFIS
jgi:hypothetical protein